MKKQFTDPWGFSKLDVYRACPQKFEYQFIQKLPQPGSAAMTRGSTMHEDIEHYLNGWAPGLTSEVAAWKDALDALKTKNFKGEQAIGIDKNWGLLPDWFAKETWLRVKMDAYFIEDDEMTVIDFKSGKFRIPSEDQIELYAVAGLSIAPQVKKVNAQFWFLDTDDVYNKTYTAEQLVLLRKKYERECQPLYTDSTWTPAPSRECRWCPYSKTKGGKCQY
jgi:hypothetical protein